MVSAGYLLSASEATMDRLSSEASESRFSSYVESLIGAIDHADRAVPLRGYCLGLLMPGTVRAWSRWRPIQAKKALDDPSRTDGKPDLIGLFASNLNHRVASATRSVAYALSAKARSMKERRCARASVAARHRRELESRQHWPEARVSGRRYRQEHGAPRLTCLIHGADDFGLADIA
jgi:hypothetical protein